MNSGEYHLPGTPLEEETPWDYFDYDEGADPLESRTPEVDADTLKAIKARKTGNKLWRIGIFQKAA